MVTSKGADCMVMGWIWTLIILLSVVFGTYTGQIGAVSAATAQGAQGGITVAHFELQLGVTAEITQVVAGGRTRCAIPLPATT